MSQADSSYITRRSMIGGGAAIVAAVPIAVLPAAASPEADAELRALGAKWDAIHAELMAHRPILEELVWSREVEVCNALGLTPNKNGVPSLPDTEISKRYFTMLVDPRFDECRKAENREAELYIQYDALDREIMGVPALTPVGLAIKARTAASSAEYLWDRPLGHLDWDKLMLRRLIEEVCKAGGMKLPAPLMPLVA